MGRLTRWHAARDSGGEKIAIAAGWAPSGRVERTGADAPVTNVYAVVGEHRQEPERLLLIGDDGRFYAYASSESEPVETDPDEDWRLDDTVQIREAAEAADAW